MNRYSTGSSWGNLWVGFVLSMVLLALVLGGKSCVDGFNAAVSETELSVTGEPAGQGQSVVLEPSATEVLPTSTPAPSATPVPTATPTPKPSVFEKVGEGFKSIPWKGIGIGLLIITVILTGWMVWLKRVQNPSQTAIQPFRGESHTREILSWICIGILLVITICLFYSSWWFLWGNHLVR